MSKRQPRDINELAFSLVNDLTSDEPPAEETPKNPVAVARGEKSGKARIAALTPERWSEIAKKAAKKRWSVS
jgi:hypothetical protein